MEIRKMTNQPGGILEVKDGLLDRLMRALENRYEKRKREGIHYSELIYCPRQALLRRMDPKPIKLREMMFFFIGECVHRGIEDLLKEDDPRVEIEKQVYYKDMIGTIDSVVDNTVCEYKTTWSSKDTLKEHYRDQDEGYAAIGGYNKGKVLIVMLQWILKGIIPFKVHEINLTDEDNKKRLEWIDKELESYRIALDKNDWKLARPVVGTSMEWKCAKGTEYECPWLEMCHDYEQKKAA